ARTIGRPRSRSASRASCCGRSSLIFSLTRSRGACPRAAEPAMAKILVVDDRAINREFLSTLLGYVGHEVTEAVDGVEALALARSTHPELIITDVLMPNMDGVELADCVHDDPAIAGTPIIFYTATFRVPEASVLAESCRVAAVLAKPAEPQAILDAVA